MVAAAADLRPPHPRPYFLFVGRLEKIKGVQDVIPAFAGQDGADLVIAGDGAYADELRRLASGCPRVRFLGYVSQENLRSLYRHALALVVPSLCFETFGLTLIEAFSSSLPVIARRLGPFPEMVEHSGGGVLFETETELREAFGVLQSNPERRRAMGASAYAAFRARWSEDVVVAQYLDLIATLKADRLRTARDRAADSDSGSSVQ